MTMWQRGGAAFALMGWPAQAAVSVREAGDMRDESLRGSFFRSQNISPEKVVRCRQVHGTTVTPVTARDAGREIPDSDGLMTAEKDLVLAIFTADCVPVIFCDTAGTAIAVVHGGWRGLAAGIIPAAVHLFRERYGIAPSGLLAASGPHIRQCCYPVGDEVKAAFHIEDPETHCDLAAVLDNELAKCGVAPAVQLGECTGHREDLFFSYRRDKTPHRMMTAVWRNSNGGHGS